MTEPVLIPTESAPKVRVTHRHWWSSVIWIVPLAAAVVASYLAYDRLQEYGPTIAVRFKEGGGLRADETLVKYRGVVIGQVTEVALSRDMQSVEVKIRLQRSATDVARKGTLFWVVGPEEVGLFNFTGLRTVITGAEIDVLPGGGEKTMQFTGLDSAPVALEVRGLKIILRADHLQSFLKANTPVYYRGVQVGIVQEVGLNATATAADVHALIDEPYAKLVHPNTVFWDASGLSMNAGLFKGVQFKLESLRALATGGIAFATPDNVLRPVRSGTVFALHSGPNDAWSQWAPQIAISREK